MTGFWLILSPAEPDAFINSSQPEGSWNGVTTAKITADFPSFKSLVQHRRVCCKLFGWYSDIGVPGKLWGSRKTEPCWIIFSFFLSLPYLLVLDMYKFLMGTLQDVISLQEDSWEWTVFIYKIPACTGRSVLWNPNSYWIIFYGWKGYLFFVLLESTYATFVCLSKLPKMGVLECESSPYP